MVFPWAAAATIGMGAASMIGDKGGISLKTLRRRGRQVLGSQYPRMQSLYGSARGKLEEGLDTIKAGNVNALRATEDAMTTGSRLAIEAGNRMRAGVGQATTSRGLGGTSIAPADARVAEESSVRMLDEIASNAGRARADIYQQGAAAEASQLGDLARLYQLQYQSEASDYFSPLFEIMTAGSGGGGGGMDLGDLSGLYPMMQEFFPGGDSS